MRSHKRLECLLVGFFLVFCLFPLGILNPDIETAVAADPPPPSNRFGNWAEPEIFNVTVTETDSAIIVNTTNGFSWELYKGSDGYNKIWLNDVVLVHNDRWYLEYQQNPNKWTQRGTPYNVVYEQLASNHVVVTRQYQDVKTSTIFNVTFDFYNNNRVKITMVGEIGKADTYQICWDATGINTEHMEHNSSANHTNIWNGAEEGMIFNYEDVYQSFGGNITTVKTEHSANNHKLHHYFYVGELGIGAFELDPTFGYKGVSTVGDNIEDVIFGFSPATPASSGTVTHINAYIHDAAGGTTGKIKFAIYKDSDKSLIGYTSEGTVTGGTTWTWYNLSIVGTPSVVASTDYLIVAWSDKQDVRVAYDFEAGYTQKYDNQVYNGFPDPFVESGTYNDGRSSIYCTYTADNTAPTVDFKTPVNGTTNITLTPKCMVYANDTDGDSLDVTWASDHSGSWQNYNTNSSISANSTPSYTFTGFSSYDTTYYWKVYVNDGTNNISEVYHFDTTLYRTNYFNDTFRNENFIDSTRNMTHESGWENFTIIPENSTILGKEGFETSVPPSGWTNVRVSGDVDWTKVTPASNPTGAHSGTYCARMIDTSQVDDITRLITPEMDLSSKVGAWVDFWYAAVDWSGDCDDLWVEWSNDGGASWNTLATYVNSDVSWTHVVLKLPSLTSTYKVSFKGNADYGYGVHVDDVYVNATSGLTSGWISSKNISKIGENQDWDKFYADVNNTAHCSFALRDPLTNYTITSNLVGNGDDISSVTNGTVRIYANFSDAPMNMRSWNISWKLGNNAPTVTSPSLSPSSGVDTYTLFYFNVTWTDADGDTPVSGYLKVLINITGGASTNNTMSWVSGSNTTGAIYTYNKQLTTSAHWNYTFWAYDGTDKTSSGPHSGPTVVAQSYSFTVTTQSSGNLDFKTWTLSLTGVGYTNQYNVTEDNTSSGTLWSMNISNTGNVALNFSMNWTGDPCPGVGTINMKWNTSNSAPNPGNCLILTDPSTTQIVTGLINNSYEQIWLWLDFVGVPSGSSTQDTYIWSEIYNG